MQLIIDNYREDSSMLISTHNVTDAETIFDTVFFLNDGKIKTIDDLDTERENKNVDLKQLYFDEFIS